MWWYDCITELYTHVSRECCLGRNPQNKTEGPEGPKSQKGPEGFEGNGPITRSIPSIHPPKYNVLKIQYNPKTVDDTEREKGKSMVWCWTQVENRKPLCTQPTQPRKAGARNMTHYNRLIYKYDQQQDRMDIGLIPSTRTLYIGYDNYHMQRSGSITKTEKGHQ